MNKTNYFADNAEASKELSRLREIERQLDATTRTTLRGLGLAEGNTVLEIGPGAGGMLSWLVDQVGDKGHVTGLDLNPRFLGHIQGDNVTVAQGDLMNPDALQPPDGGYDIVYARYVMLHLSDPSTALARIRGLLKPGGAALLVDPDFSSMRPVDSAQKGAEVFDRQLMWFTKALHDLNVMDLDYGRKSPGLMETAGFEKVDAVGYTKVIRGGTPDAQFWEDSARTSAPFVAQAGLVNDPEADIDYSSFRDPEFRFMSVVDFFVSGRVPA